MFLTHFNPTPIYIYIYIYIYRYITYIGIFDLTLTLPSSHIRDSNSKTPQLWNPNYFHVPLTSYFAFIVHKGYQICDPYGSICHF